MTYYILFPQDTEEDCSNDCNILGHVSFNKFHRNDGFDVLNNAIINFDHLILSSIRIIDSNGINHTITDFLDIVAELTK